MSKQFFNVVFRKDGEQTISEVPVSFAKGEPYAVGQVLRKVFKIPDEQSYTLMNMNTDEIFESVDLLPINPEHLYQIFIEFSEPEEEIMPELVSESDSDSDSDSEDFKITGESSKASCTSEPFKNDAASTNNVSTKIIWPVGVSHTSKVPLDVDGSKLFGTHFKGELTGGRKGLPLLQLDFFVNNRTWSEAGKTTWKGLSDVYGKQNVLARSMHCLGEYVCKDEECVFFQVGGKHFVKRMSRTTGKNEDDFLGHKVHGPACPKCQTPTEYVACSARAIAARVDLEDVPGCLLFFEHKGVHTCTPVQKKGKAILSPDTQEAIAKVVPTFGNASGEKLKAAATMEAFQKMLSSDEGSLEDVFKVAREVQDQRAVKEEVLKAKANTGKRPMQKDADIEWGELDRMLKKKNLRVFHFDRHPLKFFMSPLDIPWCPAEIMLLMDRRIGKPPFNTAACYSDAGHSCVKSSAVEQMCTVIHGIGILKLATFPLPGGERGEDEAKMWAGCDHVISVRHQEDVSGKFLDKHACQKEFNGGKPEFRPFMLVRDSGGGGWAGARLHFNKHLPEKERRGVRITNEEGECIEKDCELHVAKAVGVHCKWLTDDFEEEQFINLTYTWLHALSPRKVMDSRKALVTFIEQQSRKDVEDNLTQFLAFYEREAQRCMHFFKNKGANLAEPLIGRDKKVFGEIVTMSEFFSVTIVSFIQQSWRLEFMLAGGHEAREHGRTGALYQERREECQAARRGRHFSYDVLQEFAETYLEKTPDTSEHRNHRPDTRRSFPKKRRLTVDLTDAEPCIRMARRIPESGAWEWSVDPDRNNPTADRSWQLSSRVDKTLVVEYLMEAHIHSTDRLGSRMSVGTQAEVAYRLKTTKGQAKMLAELFLGETKLKVLQVGAPTPRLTRFNVVNGVLDRAFTVAVEGGSSQTVVFGYLDAARDIHFGERGASQVRKQRVSCSCKAWTNLMGRHGRSSAVHWCVHICFVLKEAEFSPGHAFYVQAGFTVQEVDYILKELEKVKITPRTSEVGAGGTGLKQGEWMLVPGSGRQASCAAALNVGQGCATQKTRTKDEGKPVKQPVLEADAPRVVVQGKRQVNGAWHESKFQFCVSHACCTRVMPNYVQIAPKPTDIQVHPDVELTAELLRKSGALTFRE
ncbi:hypothetical protein CYMTET_52726 [Cymbomonas tetramitiformis]|uniref:Uncharacterized protein n=1 Tax=Cymbomonas tetramitiformis TaxID=36881 RepID=A0AAE0EQI1_9CHLO|nr:hypothetical protein CYMTET_52726 [Cymbomonas tetramitiformis]